jgi:hypothetical protein
MSGELRVGLREGLVAIVVVVGAGLAYVLADLPPSTIITAPFVLIGVIGLYLSARKLQRSLQRSEFEPVQAEVLHSELRSQTETDSGARTTTYFPDIEYEYTVDGETYTSDSVYPGRLGGTSDRSANQSIVDDHSAGDRIEAYYHPEDPARSFLVDKSSTKQAVLGILAGIVLGSIGLYMLWMTFR